MKETKGEIKTEAEDSELGNKIGAIILKVIKPLLFSVTGYSNHPTKKLVKILHCEFIGTINEGYFKETK